MKISTKLLFGFLIGVILVFAQAVIFYKSQSYILDSAMQVKEIEAPLGTLSEQVIGYDAILTGHVHAALLGAQKGDFANIAEHKAKYEEAGVLLDDLLKKDARILLNQSTRPQASKDIANGYLKNLDKINLLLVDREERAFASMAKGDTDTAYSLVIGRDYDKYKKELYQNYRAWADLEHRKTIKISNDIFKKSQQVIYMTFAFAILFVMIMFVIVMIIRSSLDFIQLKKPKKVKTKR